MKTHTPFPLHAGFLALVRNEADRQRQNEHFGIAKNYDCACRSFCRFLTSRHLSDIPFAELSPSVVADYEAWMLAQGLCRNTTSCYLRCLQAVYNRYIRSYNIADNRPFQHVYRGVAPTIKRALAPDDLRRLFSLDIASSLCSMGFVPESRPFLSRFSQLQMARDLFVFSFCARGMSFIDLAYLRKSDISGNTITYIRRKTHQPIVVHVEPLMTQIINRYPSNSEYLFPLLVPSADKSILYHQYHRIITWYNDCLSSLGQMSGGINLTSYVCRHSWATAARFCQIPISVISQSMGHHSEHTTEIYLRSLESNVIDSANHHLLQSIFNQPNAVNDNVSTYAYPV